MTANEILDSILKTVYDEDFFNQAEQESNEIILFDAHKIRKHMGTIVLDNFLDEKPSDILIPHTQLMPSALQILVKDGYLDADGVHFSRNLKGWQFIVNGGYSKQQRQSAISANLQLVQTWVIALGALIAAVYYGLEVHSYHPHFYSIVASHWCFGILGILSFFLLYKWLKPKVSRWLKK